jgi:MFS family permease
MLISLHRSSGNVGDSIGPVIFGSLLLVFSWRNVMGIGIPAVLVLSLLIAVFLRPAKDTRSAGIAFSHNLSMQLRLTAQSLRGFGMFPLLVVSALRGMADRSLVLYLPFFMKEELNMGSVASGVHLALLALPGIVTDPIIGSIGDRVGRKPLIVGIMLVSSVLPLAMAWSHGGIGLTLSAATFGLLFFSVNSLTQAAAIDLAEGRRVEGTFVGLMWGNNALFSAVSPVVAGVLAGVWGFEVALYYAASLFFLGFLASLAVPAVRPYRPQAA